MSNTHDSTGSRISNLTALPRWEGTLSPQSYQFNDGKAEKGGGDDGNEENRRSTSMGIWLLLMVAAVLIVAIVLGAVLGTFVTPGHRSTGASRPPLTPPSPPSPISSGYPQSQISSLAVTGRAASGTLDYSMVWVFSQDDEGYLSKSTFNSSTGTWTVASRFTSAKRGSSLAATALDSTFYKDGSNDSFPGMHYQVELLYLDENGYISEWTFPDNGPASGFPGSLNQQRYIAASTSSLTSYWPTLVFQNVSGAIQEINFHCDTISWHDRPLGTTEAMNGTELIMVPFGNNLSATGLFYRQSDEMFVNYERTVENNTMSMAIWTNEVFADRIPVNASVTAFSTVRVDSASLNKYLLWQDLNDTIQMTWSDDDSGWKAPQTFAAFDKADKGTPIACVTGLTFTSFPMAPGYDVSRCYFLAGGAVREASFNGTTWIALGSVAVGF